jgi:ABC-type Mn2+/Zn2+ transport system ATPase subunit
MMYDVVDSRSLKQVINPDGFNEAMYTTAKLQDVIVKILNGDLRLIKKNTPESALRSIVADWYNTVYSVMMDGDTIDVMSPGKKALVLLKLLISLAESNCPILIDQPEDDLDNRSIFNDLILFIKTKKKDRQIIIVTHNANIVLGSDAEEIIVANQNGKDSPQCERRFEYRSGSIENSEPVIKETGEIADGILNSRGIQQHICDILEGGVKAFELRKHKYHI